MATTGPTTDHDEIRGWAEQNQIVPVQLLPGLVDHEPASMRLVFARSVKDRLDLQLMTWEDFFILFDTLGLTFVYDSEATGANEILQIEGRSAYRNPLYQLVPAEN